MEVVESELKTSEKPSLKDMEILHIILVVECYCILDIQPEKFVILRTAAVSN